MQNRTQTIPFLTTGTTGTSQAFDMTPFEAATFYMTASGTVTGGTIQIEEAYYASGTPIPATWAAVGTGTTGSGLTSAATHLTSGAYAWLRVRISTAIAGGGSVTVVGVFK